jgi:hypothetical protein
MAKVVTNSPRRRALPSFLVNETLTAVDILIQTEAL